MRIKILKFLLFFVLLAFIYYFSPDILNLIKDIKNISLTDFIILSALCIANQILLGLEIKILCKSFDIHLSFIECVGLSSVRSIANYLPLGAGVASNAIYLKKQKKLSFAHYTSSLSVSLVLMIMTASFMGFLTSFYMIFKQNFFRIELLMLFFLVFTASLIIMLFKIPLAKSDNYVMRFLKNFQNGYEFLKNDKKTIKKLLFLKIAILLLLILKMKILFISINYQIHFGVIILISMSIVSFSVATILPGNIGLTEAVSGIIANLSGSTFEYGFMGIATDRIIQAIWIFFLGIPFLLYFTHKLSYKSKA